MLAIGMNKERTDLLALNCSGADNMAGLFGDKAETFPVEQLDFGLAEIVDQRPEPFD